MISRMISIAYHAVVMTTKLQLRLMKTSIHSHHGAFMRKRCHYHHYLRHVYSSNTHSNVLQQQQQHIIHMANHSTKVSAVCTTVEHHEEQQEEEEEVIEKFWERKPMKPTLRLGYVLNKRILSSMIGDLVSDPWLDSKHRYWVMMHMRNLYTHPSLDSTYRHRHLYMCFTALNNRGLSLLEAEVHAAMRVCELLPRGVSVASQILRNFERHNHVDVSTLRHYARVCLACRDEEAFIAALNVQIERFGAVTTRTFALFGHIPSLRMLCALVEAFLVPPFSSSAVVKDNPALLTCLLRNCNANVLSDGSSRTVISVLADAVFSFSRDIGVPLNDEHLVHLMRSFRGSPRAKTFSLNIVTLLSRDGTQPGSDVLKEMAINYADGTSLVEVPMVCSELRKAGIMLTTDFITALFWAVLLNRRPDDFKEQNLLLENKESDWSERGVKLLRSLRTINNHEAKTLENSKSTLVDTYCFDSCLKTVRQDVATFWEATELGEENFGSESSNMSSIDCIGILLGRTVTGYLTSLGLQSNDSTRALCATLLRKTNSGRGEEQKREESISMPNIDDSFPELLPSSQPLENYRQKLKAVTPGDVSLARSILHDASRGSLVPFRDIKFASLYLRCMGPSLQSSTNALDVAKTVLRAGGKLDDRFFTEVFRVCQQRADWRGAFIIAKRIPSIAPHVTFNTFLAAQLVDVVITRQRGRWDALTDGEECALASCSPEDAADAIRRRNEIAEMLVDGEAFIDSSLRVVKHWPTSRDTLMQLLCVLETVGFSWESHSNDAIYNTIITGFLDFDDTSGALGVLRHLYRHGFKPQPNGLVRLVGHMHWLKVSNSNMNMDFLRYYKLLDAIISELVTRNSLHKLSPVVYNFVKKRLHHVRSYSLKEIMLADSMADTLGDVFSEASN